jgi:outer membrane protein OmpA-like peptidoglycan-associated protein
MASKKNLLLLGTILFISLQLFSQSYDWKDESLIPKNGKSQHSEFLKNQYPFPAKPRNQWEIGVSVGNVAISGDVATRFPNIGWGVHIRKAMGYIFSARLAYSGGIARGMNWQPSFNYGRNTAWANNYVAPVNQQYLNAPLQPGMIPGQLYQVNSTNKSVVFDPKNADPVYMNYKTNIHQLALQGIITLNNVRFHKAKTGFLLYAIGGVGAMIYDVNINTLDERGGTYAQLFRKINASYNSGYSSRRDVLRDLRAGMDKSYETPAESESDRRPNLFNRTMKPTVMAGIGVTFKINKKLSIGIEEVHTWTNDDLLDGQRWQETPVGDAAMTRDFDTWHYTNINLNYALGTKKSVQPLWWLNPLDFTYNEVNSPKHMKMPKPILDDADGDGVTDQFDLEPNTPAGSPVDAHGVSRDTDGDGVPDIKDKELITPTQCQPVDADGVGKCPEPECCKNMVNVNDLLKQCNLTDLPSINFTGKSIDLSSESKALVGSVATSLRSNPNCKVIICGSASKSKSGQSLGQKRVDAVVKYLVETQGISADRVVAQYDCSEGDPSVVELRAEQK